MVLKKIYDYWLTQFLLISITAIALGFVISYTGLGGAGVFIAVPIGLIYLYLLFKNPKLGLYSVLHFAFFSNGISRYSTAPVGLAIDVLLLLTLIAASFKLKKRNYKFLKNPLVYGMALWTLFTIAEIFNPESRSFAAWFYAVRGLSLYMIQLIILCLLLLNDRKELKTFLRVWIVWSFIAGLWAMKQVYIGLNSYEQAWLNAGAYKTHLLFGQLRAFSFYSDAGQFGAAMGHILLICLVLALGPFKFFEKIMYWVLAAFFFWCMAISGTRGALFVPLVGFFVYLILSRNFKILTAGGVVMAILFYILKFTFIGQSNYQIQRLRSALNTNDASFQVRLDNQRKLVTYLSSRPLGGGIGSAGYWGQRFSPGTFLAETPTDSWYVRVWVETGIIGLWVHIAVIVCLLITGFVCVTKMKNDLALRQKAIALFAGFAGIAVASYGNQVIGQTPTSIVTFFSIVFVWFAYRWDKHAKPETIINTEL